MNVKIDKEVEAFQALYKDLLYIVEKHHVTWEWFAEFVTIYSKFGWEIGTAQDEALNEEKPK